MYETNFTYLNYTPLPKICQVCRRCNKKPHGSSYGFISYILKNLFAFSTVRAAISASATPRSSATVLTVRAT